MSYGEATWSGFDPLVSCSAAEPGGAAGRGRMPASGDIDSNVNAFCHCPPVADKNRDAMRTTSMMGGCNASALMPAGKSSNGVLLSRF